MPIAATVIDRAASSAATSPSVSTVTRQMSSASCSTQPGPREVLRELAIRATDRVSVAVDRERAHAGGAGVDRDDCRVVGAHSASSSRSVRCRISSDQPGIPWRLAHLEQQRTVLAGADAQLQAPLLLAFHDVQPIKVYVVHAASGLAGEESDREQHELVVGADDEVERTGGDDRRHGGRRARPRPGPTPRDARCCSACVRAGAWLGGSAVECPGARLPARGAWDRASWRPSSLRVRDARQDRAANPTIRGGDMRIGMLTGGGDCPGLNAVIRAVVRRARASTATRSWGTATGGAACSKASRWISRESAVRGLLPRGGTILGTSRTNPYKTDGGQQRVLSTLKRDRIDALDRRSAAKTRSASPRSFRTTACASSVCRRPSTTI